jgi:hypothetical protein
VDRGGEEGPEGGPGQVFSAFRLRRAGAGTSVTKSAPTTRASPALITPPDKDHEVREEFEPSERSLVVATVTVAATYVYFLIFAQFGFLQAVAAAGHSGDSLLRAIMGAMGVGGITGGLVMARIFHERRCRGQLMAGFVVAGAAAGLTWVARTPALFLLCAALTGTGTGMVTVGLAGMFRREVGGGKLGLCLGTGTGVAYAICNLPFIFNGSFPMKAMLGIVAACTGLLAVQLFEQRAPRQAAGGYDYTPGGIAAWTGIFLALVWVDSAAFFIIQNTPDLKMAGWVGRPWLLLNAGVHLITGVAAGLLLDRRWLAQTVGIGAALLIIACLLLGHGSGRQSLAAALYAAGVSLYSTALVVYPARSSRPGLAALVFAVAGWIGSGLGIGMAQNHDRIPVWFLGVSGFVLAGLFLARHFARRQPASFKK